MLKIKINLNRYEYKTILNDMKEFNIVKKNNTINKNLFLNILFKNYYEEYQNTKAKLLDDVLKIKNKYNIDNDEFINDLMKSINKYTLNDNITSFNSSITFYLSDDNEFIFNNLNDFNKESCSSYFRKLILSYLEKPMYIREQIIHKDFIIKINNAIKKSNILIINTTLTFNVIPYKIITDIEEIHSYLLCIKEGKKTKLSISSINKIILSNQKYNLSKDDILLLNK